MMISWATFAVHAVLALGLVGVALAYARRIGGFGPYVLAVVPALEVLTGGVFRVASAATLASIRSGHGSIAHAESVFNVMALMGAAMVGLSTLLVVVAFVYMRAPGAST